jgi:hypothetical protein
VAATFSLTALVFGFVESSSMGWSNPLVGSAIAAGGAGIIAFLRIEGRAASPMVPLALFRSATFAGANLLTLFLYSAVGMFFFVFPLNLIQVQGYSATSTGGAMLPLILLIFLLSRWSGGLVHRYGARLPLMIGPVITACGFFLFAIPTVGGSYWSAFFPAMLTLGFGMAVSVAPLTTVVMNAVDRNHVGTASGINNAVARLAGVLAIAVLGAVMVADFGSHLRHELSHVTLPAGTRAALESGQDKLAGLRPPGGLEPQAAVSVESSIAAAFISSFRLMMWICAALALASAGVAWRWIPGGARVSVPETAVAV